MVTLPSLRSTALTRVWARCLKRGPTHLIPRRSATGKAATTCQDLLLAEIVAGTARWNSRKPICMPQPPDETPPVLKVTHRSSLERRISSANREKSQFSKVPSGLRRSRPKSGSAQQVTAATAFTNFSILPMCSPAMFTRPEPAM